MYERCLLKGEYIEFNNAAGGKVLFKYSGRKATPGFSIQTEAKGTRVGRFYDEIAIEGTEEKAVVNRGVFSAEELARGCTLRDGYPVLKGIPLHRVVWSRTHKCVVPKGFSIDHTNRVRTDARVCNLRLASASEQRRNQNRVLFPNRH